MTNLPKLLIIADATWGKDTVAEILSTYGYNCMASSTFATERVMMPYFESVGKVYKSPEEAFQDRINFRQVWYQQIEAYNAPTWDRMVKEMFDSGYDVYVGMRSPSEYAATRSLFDHVIWVDASKRLPRESITSNGLNESHADIFIDNNGTLEDLRENTYQLVKSLGYTGERKI